MVSLNELEKLADEIPSIGNGGWLIKKYLIGSVKNIPNDSAIIDIAPWLGSTTAYLSLGLHKYGKQHISIYCYDKWEIDEEYLRKMHRFQMDWREGQDALPIFTKNLEPFGIDIYPTRGDITLSKEYDGPKIGLIVDDICSGKKLFDKMLKLFIPHLIEGSEIIMLDALFCAWKPEKYSKLDYSYQKRVIESNPKVFQITRKEKNCMMATYLGGTPKLCPR